MSTNPSLLEFVCDSCKLKAGYEVGLNSWTEIDIVEKKLINGPPNLLMRSNTKLHLCPKCSKDVLLWMKDGFN